MNNALYPNWYNYFCFCSQKNKITKLKLTTQAQISSDEILKNYNCSSRMKNNVFFKLLHRAILRLEDALTEVTTHV